MKVLQLSGYEYVLPLLVLLLIPSALPAQRRSGAPTIVTHYCSGCHEVDGKSQLSYIPRLAGQNAAYVLRKLQTFRAADSSPVDEFTRVVRFENPAGADIRITRAASIHMVGVARAVSEADKKAAAEWYAAQTPAAGRSGRRELIEEGRDLFINGLQAKGLTACQDCHGPDAKGNDHAPRLAGQNATYLMNQLALYKESDPHHSPEMSIVARSVEGAQARAVAAYLQSLGSTSH